MLNEAFGFQRPDVIESWIPRFHFSVFVSLSLVYHVLRLSRIRQRFNQTQDNADSLFFDIQSRGCVVTAAAFLMVSVLLALLIVTSP